LRRPSQEFNSMLFAPTASPRSFTVTDVSNLQYADIDGVGVAMTVKFAEFPNPVPFLASPHDLEMHGRDLAARAKRGEFGEIKPFVPQAPPPKPNVFSRVVKAIRG
jgi:hypothetical protein